MDIESIKSICLRIFAAFIAAWFFGGASDKGRFYSGAISGVVCSVLSFSFLAPVFLSIKLELAEVALYILTVFAAAVGMCVGVLLPVLSMSAGLGLSIVMMAGIYFSPSIVNFAIVGPISAMIASIVALKWFNFIKPLSQIHTVAVIVVGGGVTSCFADSRVFPSIMDAILSYDHRSTPGHETRVSTHPGVVGIWFLGCLLVAISLFYQSAKLKFSLASSASEESVKKLNKKSRYQRSESLIPTASVEAFNMFNPAYLPPRLAEYANIVYHACEDLGNFFGFQDSSVRNQAEHLLILVSNHRRYMTILPAIKQPPSPVHAVHQKMFSNYYKWCSAMGVSPIFSKMHSTCNTGPSATVSRVVDLVLYLSIWGEAANLRHMPECIWFLYHKMMDEYCSCDGYTQTRSLYAGYFTDNVVFPIYDILAKSMKSIADHQDKRNYDDFNEFFWSRECLKYRYCSIHEDLDIEDMMNTPYNEVNMPSIAEGLLAAPKTFLEKRSWFRAILAFNRVIEWHIVTFYLLGVISFSRQLVWGWVYSFQVASGVFWIVNVLYIIWSVLEVWAAYPSISLPVVAIFGSVFTLTARFTILVYQTLYLMWTFGPQQGYYFGIEADSNFWWWQYIWLSLLCMVPYLFDTLLQFVPVFSTIFYTSRNDYVQSFLNIIYPLSRIYVGKEVHESFSRTMKYVFFWLTLIAWKLFFSYMFEVHSMVLPTLELTDDYQNYLDQSFATMSLLLLLRWSPQFLVYNIDMIIWYALWQAIAGTAVGLAENLGDIRSMKDIRRIFSKTPDQFCKKFLSSDAGSRRGSSASFNSRMSLSNPNLENTSLLGSDPHQLQSYVNRLLDVRIQKWVMFSAVWNEIIDTFRQEDIISNTERDYLKFSRFEGFSQAIYLPLFQTAGVVESAMTQIELSRNEAKVGSVMDEIYFKNIFNNDIMSTAVSEVWELGNYILLQLFGKVHNDDMVTIMNLILKWTKNGHLSKHLMVENLRALMTNFVTLIITLHKGLRSRKPASILRKSKKKVAKRITVESTFSGRPGAIRRVVSASSLMLGDPGQRTLHRMKEHENINTNIDALRDQVRDKLRNTVNSLKGIIRFANSSDESQNLLDRITFMLSMENGFFWDDDYASDRLDEVAKKKMFFRVLSKVHGLVACHPDDVEPKSKEAKRRLTFFVNSLFMKIPNAPSIQDMLSWTVLTPFYSEDVIYTKKDLESRNDTLGVSTLLYLQTLFKSDWANFLERLGIKDDEKIWSKKFVEETRIWASIRSQTLSRTVSGMMYYEKAIRLLANLERNDEKFTNDILGEKFGYILACQVYGNMKKHQDPKADDIEQLMHRYPHCRVAYIDNVRLNREGATVYFSVLVKSNGRGGIEEVYRVRLPGNPVVGEGKPENQNHALIFTRSEYIQTIDMNQEGYFEEALKMRNALQEFTKREGPLPTTILGLREHIFTGSVSSLANYMALQEISFVSLGQRVLATPLCIRLHYGHPDVFDKLFAMTRGGVSKASKGINLSEDIFAGYNNVLRGGQVAFKEYMQIGKGRDVGMSQIFKFEAKLSQGSAEQSLSRDVYRMANRLDFFRLLSYYFGGIGHYFVNVLTVFTVYIVVYVMLILAIFDEEKIGDRMITPTGTIQMFLGGLGLLQTIPLFATLGVDRGWFQAIQEIIKVFATGGPLHFMFHIQTKANFMCQTILVGGAKYRATGRGFVTQHTSMDKNYRFYASSHLYLGVELAAGLILMGIYTDAGQYVGRTWSLWLASGSFLVSPFWFNPLSFEWPVVTSDYNKFLKWLIGSSGDASKSWSAWWLEENSFYSKMPLPSKMIFLIKAVLYLAIGEGIRRSDLFERDITLYEPFINVSFLLIVIVACIIFIIFFMEHGNNLPYPIHRAISIFFGCILSSSVVLVFIEDINCLRYTLSAYYGIGALCLLGLLAGVKAVKSFYFVHDIVVGHLIFIPLFIFAAAQVPHYIQTWLLYHNALSSDVVVSDILRYARKNQEAVSGSDNKDEDLLEQIAELRKIVMKQEKILQEKHNDYGGKISQKDNALAGLVSSPPPAIFDTRAATPRSSGLIRPVAKRVMSMSGLDVWGGMATGSDTSGLVSTDFYQQQVPTTSAQAVDGFTFTQPVDMPPR